MESHEYANLFPMLPDAELAELAADIKAHGLQTRITTYQGKILDGRNRWRACEIAGVTPATIEFTGADPLAFVVSGNLIRRHLSESQRGMVASKLANLHVGNPSFGAIAPIGAIAPVSRAKAAQMLNVGQGTIDRARSVIKKGTPELAAAVESGEITVNAAAELAKLPAARQLEVLAEGTEAVKEKAKEIRDFGGEIAPAPKSSIPATTEAAPKRIAYRPALGMEILAKAIATMQTIGDTDKEFESAYQAMLDHCNDRLTRKRK